MSRRIPRLFNKKTTYEWWGFKHINDIIFLRRYLNPDDLQDAKMSPYVVEVYDRFEAPNREEALKMISKNYQKV